jgi:hypothetical protein
MSSRFGARAAALLAVGVLAGAACGSDDAGSDGTDTTESDDAAEPDHTGDNEDPDDTVEAATDPATAPTTAEQQATDPDGTESSDQTVADTAADPFADSQVDDSALCMAQGRLFASFFIPALIVSDSELGEGETSGEPVEAFEIVVYPALTEDAVVLRAEAPPAVQTANETLLVRVDAAPRALAAGGFSEAEIQTYADAWNAGLDDLLAGRNSPQPDVDDSAQNEGKLAAAVDAYVAEVGTLEEFFASTADSDPAVDEAADAWLNETCPVLANTLDTL